MTLCCPRPRWSRAPCCRVLARSPPAAAGTCPLHARAAACPAGRGSAGRRPAVGRRRVRAVAVLPAVDVDVAARRAPWPRRPVAVPRAVAAPRHWPSPCPAVPAAGRRSRERARLASPGRARVRAAPRHWPSPHQAPPRELAGPRLPPARALAAVGWRQPPPRELAGPRPPPHPGR
nr:atherin-like [Aegilops tauschii subsp. strangulata]